MLPYTSNTLETLTKYPQIIEKHLKSNLSECRDSNPESLAPKARMLAVTPHSVYTCKKILTTLK